MIVGFLGKGGSGKSTISTLFAKYLHEEGDTVLAVDADHNMDLSNNLGEGQSMTYLGSALEDLLRFCSLDPETQKYHEAFFQKEKPVFALTPADSFTQTYATKVKDGMYLMASGPHTDKVLYGRYCSHALSTPLKVYLPYLQLADGQSVVVDEKAGSDGAGTGIASGLDFAFVLSEPTPQGLKAAKQIGELLDFFGTPYAIVINKVFDDTDKEFAKESAHKEPIHYLKLDRNVRSITDDVPDSMKESLSILKAYATEHASKDRLERSTKKFTQNKDFEEKMHHKKHVYSIIFI